MKIKITRGEGPNSECGKSVECATFAEINETLRRWSNTAPEGGGYDKCDVRIVDEAANFTYDGRYDLKHWRDEEPSLKRHVVGVLRFASGEACPDRMTQAAYIKLLTVTYEFSPADLLDAVRMADLVEGHQ